MPLALGTAGLVLITLLWVLALPRLLESVPPILRALLARIQHHAEPVLVDGYDPGRELRAEQRARALLRSCVNDEEWAMYSELGFLRVWGTLSERPRTARSGAALLRLIDERTLRTRGSARLVGGRWASVGGLVRLIGKRRSSVERGADVPYAYLIYPHAPILAYIPQSGALLGEYCVAFPDRTRPYGSARLPDADDVLAKWMALTTHERSLIERSNLHLPGRQIGIAQARRDLVRLSCWERERANIPRAPQPVERSGPRERASLRAGSVPAL
jgi:hypothetical protein